MKYIDLDIRDEVSLIAIDEPIVNNGTFSLDIWGYEYQSAIINITKADEDEVIIQSFEIISHNSIDLAFEQKKYPIKICNLIFRGTGFVFKGGALIENLFINADGPQTIIELYNNPADNVIIEQTYNEDIEAIRKLLTAIEIIPASGEYILDYDYSPNQAARVCLTELRTSLPKIKWIAPVVSWFATSTDIKDCEILPGIDVKYIHPNGAHWNVGKYNTLTAHKISYIIYEEEEEINYGGTINDESILKFLNDAKTKDLKIIFYPLIMVDVMQKPWRGRITGSPEHVDKFFNEQYEPFILHYANLIKGKVDAFIIGSELIGLTKIALNDSIFPFAVNLIKLASRVKQILGPETKVTYAADWSEYHTADGVQRPLDELWASPAIDFVGIDAYFPLTYSMKSRMTIDEIKSGWKSGEGYDYYLKDGEKIYYPSGEYWNAWKNLEYWWNSEHWVGSCKTKWQPKMKPIWFTEFGFPSIDKAPNKPNVFFDPKSSENGIPSFSNGKVDFAIQRKALRATLEFWQNSEFLENLICWTWDARGINWHKGYYLKNSQLLFKDFCFKDSRLWEPGHWVDGKIMPPTSLMLVGNMKLYNLAINAKSVIIDATINVLESFTIQTLGDLNVLGKPSSIISKLESSDDELELHATNKTQNQDDSKILIEKGSFDVKGSIGIGSLLIKVKTLLMKCYDLSIGQSIIDAENLIVLSEKLLTIFKSPISANNLALKCLDFKVHCSKIMVQADLIISAKNSFTVTAEIIENSKVYSNGSKDKHFETLETISQTEIVAGRIILKVGGNSNIESAIINSNGFFKVKAGFLQLTACITKYEHIIEFTGEEKWYGGDRQEWTDIVRNQEAYPVIITAEVLDIRIRTDFNAYGSKIIAKDAYFEAINYNFKGITLDNSHSHDSEKPGFFSSSSSSARESATDIIGVEILIRDEAYIIANGKLLLQGSTIKADKIAIESNSLEIGGLVGNRYKSMSVSKSGVRLALNFGSGEASIGAELYKEQCKMKYYGEYLVPSGLIGRSLLTIDTDILLQNGGILAGGKGKIRALEWKAVAPKLSESFECYQMQANLGARIGIKENISGTIQGLNNTAQGLLNFNPDNAFAGVNTISNLYGNIRDVTNLLSGNIINAGAWIQAGINVGHMQRTQTSYFANLANFDHLEADITSNITGGLRINAITRNIRAQNIDLFIPEDSETSFGYNIGGQISSTGSYSISGQIERNGITAGLGYSGNLGEHSGAFGNAMNIVYGNGDNQLNITYADMNRERVAHAWDGNFAERAISNITTETAHLMNLVDHPTIVFTELQNQVLDLLPINQPQANKIELIPKTIDIVKEKNIEFNLLLNDVENELESVPHIPNTIPGNPSPEMLPDAEERQIIEPLTFEEIFAAKYQLYINRLEHVAKSLQGFDKELVTEAIDKYKQMIIRKDNSRDFTAVMEEVLNRHRTGQTPGARVIIDAIGEAWNFAGDELNILLDKHLTHSKAGLGALASMAGKRIFNGIEYVVGIKKLETMGAYVNKIHQYGEEHLAPGERKIVELGIGGLVATLVGVAGGSIKQQIKINKKTLLAIDSVIAEPLNIAQNNLMHLAQPISFMGVSGEKAALYHAQHFESVKRHVVSLVNNEAIKLAVGESAELQTSKLTQFYQKQFLKYQNWSNIEGREWKMKIVGNPQHTKTEGHARAMTQLAIEAAKKPEVDLVFMNQGINKATGMKHSPNIRPDDIIVYSNGKFTFLEVQSKSDLVKDLKARNKFGMESLPKNMRGETHVLEISEILKRKNQ